MKQKKFNRAKYEEETSNLTEWNPLSKYEEKVSIEGLTLYDIFREPRPVSLSEPKPKQSDLYLAFSCLICSGIFRKAMVVKDCMHRFCHGCIVDALRLGKKECPICRIPVASKRNLRPDTDLDALIASIYPDLDFFEKQNDQQIAEVNKKRTRNSACMESWRIKQEQQQLKRRKRKSDSSHAMEVAAPSGETTQQKSPNRLIANCKDVDFLFKPETQFLKCNPHHFNKELEKHHRVPVVAKINHIRKYLFKCLISSNLSSDTTLVDISQIILSVDVKGEAGSNALLEMKDSKSLSEIKEIINGKSKIVLYYRVENRS